MKIPKCNAAEPASPTRSCKLQMAGAEAQNKMSRARIKRGGQKRPLPARNEEHAFRPQTRSIPKADAQSIGASCQSAPCQMRTLSNEKIQHRTADERD